MKNTDEKRKLQKVKSGIKNHAYEILVFAHFALTYTILMTGFISNGTKWYMVLLSLCFAMPILVVEFLLPVRYTAVCIFNSVLFFLIFYVNELVIIARGRPINYVDVYSIGNAWSVKDHYSMPINLNVVVRLMLAVFVLVIFHYAIVRLEKKMTFVRKRRVFTAIALGIFAPILIFAGAKFHLLAFNSLGFNEGAYVRDNTLLVAWVYEFYNSRIVAPSGYDPEMTDRIFAKYEATEEYDEAQIPENIIVIMNESLADYSLIGNTDLKADPLPFIHSMSENCVKGKLAVNVFGGNTANSEFEFLTGNALYFMPWGSVPYMKYRLDGCETLTETLSALGYDTTAVHPYYAEEWKRTQNYVALGFDDFISGENFGTGYVQKADINLFEDLNNGVMRDFGQELEYYRGFISDKECYDRILDTVRSDNEHGKKSFVFSVTIQNHGAYDKKVLEYDGMQQYTDGEDIAVETYLNLCRISDEAFRELIEEVSKMPEKTVVVMFGDHQPNIEFTSYKNGKTYSSGTNTWCATADKYTVPYIMWANYDVDWVEEEMVSVNYLSAMLKKSVGLPLTSFDNLRLAAMEDVPVLTKAFCAGSNGFITNNSVARASGNVKAYELIQYKRMFDDK
ncbi:MAG: LTA synthase family protein [Acetatifactor sp.]|nr:LTA synthase family protein [Acetatifactor sp.]